MIKKLFFIFMLTITSQNVFATDFKCRSYNTGNLLDYTSENQTLIYRDRFGNEINAWSPIEVIESADDVMLYFDKEKMLSINTNDQTANWLWINDFSFHCRFIVL